MLLCVVVCLLCLCCVVDVARCRVLLSMFCVVYIVGKCLLLVVDIVVSCCCVFVVFVWYHWSLPGIGVCCCLFLLMVCAIIRGC